MSTTDNHTSPVARILAALRVLDASWSVEIGRPSASGWIVGKELADATAGPLNELLLRIGARLKTTDRRTIAALYALRFGWASAMAIAPYVKYNCVPDVTLENISLKFKESTFFERTAIHEARGALLDSEPSENHAGITRVPDRHALLRLLRRALTAQSAPVVEALHIWSGFAPRGTWGMLTSSWAAHLTTLSAVGVDQSAVLPELQEFFEGDDIVARMQPRLHTVTYRDTTHVYQRRGSCCRFYLLPKGELCASCPLVSHDQRLARNLTWMQRQLDGLQESRGHS